MSRHLSQSLIAVGHPVDLVKPCSVSELTTRLRALPRRRQRPLVNLARADDLELGLVENTAPQAGPPWTRVCCSRAEGQFGHKYEDCLEDDPRVQAHAWPAANLHKAGVSPWH